jgi:OOP family OmpA-OmpF porin
MLRTTSPAVALGLLTAGLAAGLAGCTTALPPEKVEAIGPPFNNEIKKGYVQLAAASGPAVIGSGHFHGKARAAMLGDDVWPDKVGSRDIPAAARPEALQLRERLVAALESNARLNAPVEAAAAQTNFDCWLAELEEAGSPDDTAGCRQAFLAALEVAEAAAVTGDLPGAYQVFFGSGRSDLDPEALVLIDEAARGAAAARAERVEVIGYADRSGDLASNQQLSERRAEAVASALTQAGVPARAIEVRAGGPTGVRDDRASRRVDIVLGR